MQVGSDDIMEQIDLENLFDDMPKYVNLFDPQDSSLKDSSPDSLTLSIDEIEELLMKDDERDDGSKCPYDDFLMDILLDSPVSESGGEVVDVLGGRNLTSLEEKKDGILGKEKEDSEDNNHNNNDNDVNSKKRKRQLRNRDAAVRSRERKKTYVRDLELKSRYFEGECKRLGMLLNCYLAENYALRNTLMMKKNANNAFVDDDASSLLTKQESAVLLLESLLLGSLLWFPGIIILWLLLLPLCHAPPQLEIVVNSKGDLKAARPSKGVIVAFRSLGKRCRGSRSRMKSSSFWYMGHVENQK